MDPKSTSTPNRLLKKRNGIHEERISPLSNASNVREYESPRGDWAKEREPLWHESDSPVKNEYTDDSDHPDPEDCETEDEDDVRKPDVINKSSSDGQWNVFMVITMLIIAFIVIQCLTGGDTSDFTAKITISDLRNKFPLQNKELWLYLRSGLSDMNTFNRPSVYIFLHEKSAETTVEELLKNISVYASCAINSDCDINPIIIEGELLNTAELINDYGKIIHRYKPQLQEKHVMIIRNLDEINGKVAQALHSFCDEYTPLVSNSLFLFTIKVDKFEGESLSQVLNILRYKWKELDSDKLEPLLARISNMVLRIAPEANV